MSAPHRVPCRHSWAVDHRGDWVCVRCGYRWRDRSRLAWGIVFVCALAVGLLSAVGLYTLLSLAVN